MDSGYYYAMLAEFFYSLFWFCGGWLIAYVLIGSWFEVIVARSKSDTKLHQKRHFFSNFIVHLAISLLMITPWAFFWIEGLYDENPGIIGSILLCIVYFGLVPLLIKLFTFRLLPKLKFLKWLLWNPPLVRTISTSLLVSLVAFGAGSLTFWQRGNIKALTCSFPLRPKSYVWKVDTNYKPLIDHSLSAESDRLLTDDRNIYIQANNREQLWKVINIEAQNLASNSDAIAYVIGDNNITWKIQKNPGELLLTPVEGGATHKISFNVSNDAVFLGREVKGRIIGANPSSGILFALDPINEKVLWQQQAPKIEHNNDRRIGCLSSSGNVVIAGLWSSRIWAVDLESGQQLWTYDEKGMGNSMYVKSTDKYVLGFSRSDNVYCFDITSGELYWKKPLGDTTGGNICILNDKCYFRTSNQITCFSISDGEILWKTEFGDHYSGGLSASEKGFVACASDRTMGLFSLDKGDCLFLTKFPAGGAREFGFNGTDIVPAKVYTHPVITKDGSIYVFMSDGKMWCLNPEL